MYMYSESTVGNADKAFSGVEVGHHLYRHTRILVGDLTPRSFIILCVNSVAQDLPFEEFSKYPPLLECPQTEAHPRLPI